MPLKLIMSLELLGNELLLDLFQFLSTAQLLRVFNRLNHRFDTLLLEHFCAHGSHFRSLSKHDFDIIFQQHLSSIVDQITSLRLADDNENQQQIDCFLDHGFNLH